jgi:hypothetical protein
VERSFLYDCSCGYFEWVGVGEFEVDCVVPKSLICFSAAFFLKKLRVVIDTLRTTTEVFTRGHPPPACLNSRLEAAL